MRHIAAAFCFVFATTPAFAQGQQPSGGNGQQPRLLITSATIDSTDPVNHLLTITGQNFVGTSGLFVVVVDGMPLTLVPGFPTATQVQTLLPNAFPPGSYVLVVSNGTTPTDSDAFNLTIGASDLTCVGCVTNDEVNISYALGDRQAGKALLADHALFAEMADHAENAQHAEFAVLADIAHHADIADHADIAHHADIADDVACLGCIDGHDVDAAQIQLRVNGACAPGESIRLINPDGTVACEVDNVGGGGVTTVTATAPLVSSGGLTPDISLPHVKFGPFQRTAVGFNALAANTTGWENTAFGYLALSSNTGAIRNTAVGYRALNRSNSNHNTALGTSTLEKTTIGINNTAAGAYALWDNTTGSFNTAIGYAANVPVGSNLNNATAIGYRATVDASNKIRLGNGAITLVETAGDLRVGAGGTVGCVQDGAGTAIAGTCPSDARLKTDITPFASLLDKLVDLEPVHFRWKADEYPELQLGSAPSFGLIAQEAERVLPELVVEDARGFKTVRYNLLPLMLLQAVKEQQEIIQRQQIENTDLSARLDLGTDEHRQQIEALLVRVAQLKRRQSN